MYGNDVMSVYSLVRALVAFTDSPVDTANMVGKGVVELLMKVMDIWYREASVMANCFQLVTNICDRDSHATLLIEHQVFRKLVNAMLRLDENAQEKLSEAFSMLSQSPRGLQLMKNDVFINDLVSMMMNHSSSELIQASWLSILWRLSASDMLNVLSTDKVIRAVAIAMTHLPASATVKNNGLGFLGNVVTVLGSTRLIMTHRLISIVIQAFEFQGTGRTHILTGALTVIHNFCMSSENQIQIVNREGIGHTLAVMTECKDDVDIRELCSKVLARIVLHAGEGDNTMTLLENGNGMDIVWKALACEDTTPELQTACNFLIAKMTAFGIQTLN